MLFFLFSTAGALTVLVQTTLAPRFPVEAVVPDLILVLCVYLGLNHHSFGAVLGAFFLGYSVDVFSSPVIGFHAFAFSLVFLAVYVSSHWIWVRSPLLSAGVVFLASGLKGTALVLLSIFFLSRNGLEIAGFLKHLALDAIVAALFAPPVFYALTRARSFLEGSRITV